MRPKKHTKIQKRGARTKINKKKNARKSHRSWGFNSDVSLENLESINEVLRVHKNRQAEGRSSWKLIPKDSCEVYKERRKKRQENQNQYTEESLSEDNQTVETDVTPSKENEKRAKQKATRNTKKCKCRPSSASSAPSYSSCTSMSTSCASNSDMEY